ncbi:hypothetical protein NDU88_000991 [Pleurodeles waltl]|uniref:Uncharacterized protein n=1 Tax=Pleurodeles waltl TaxID=8319 RepID=A0AAV7RBC2_PLEWA|nr:hypothetical protein NDU88_000991 [Pleurodeles waltl]
MLGVSLWYPISLSGARGQSLWSLSGTRGQIVVPGGQSLVAGVSLRCPVAGVSLRLGGGRRSPAAPAHSGSAGQRSLRWRSRLSSKGLSSPGRRQGVRGAYRGSGRLPEESGGPPRFLRRPTACLWVLKGLCLSRARPSAALNALSAPGVPPPADLRVPRGRPSACLRPPRGLPSAVSGPSPGPWGRPSALSRGPGRVMQPARACDAEPGSVGYGKRHCSCNMCSLVVTVFLGATTALLLCRAASGAAAASLSVDFSSSRFPAPSPR